MQSIIVAYAKAEDARKIRALLLRNGRDVAAVTSSGAQALAHAETLERGIIICGYRLRDMLYHELAENMPAGFYMAVITSPVHLDEAHRTERTVFLTTPLRVRELLQTLEEFDREVPRARKTPPGDSGKTEEEKRIISQAKAVLMERNHMTEAEAHRYLQKCAMDSGNRLAESAGMVLLLSSQIVQKERQ